MVFTNINNIYTNVIFPFPFVRLSYLPSQRDGCPLVGHSSTFTKLLSSLIAKVENPVRQPSYFLGCSVSKISVALPTLCVPVPPTGHSMLGNFVTLAKLPSNTKYFEGKTEYFPQTKAWYLST